MLFEKTIQGLYRQNVCIRQDNAGGIFYFGPGDFPGLQAHPYGFRARGGYDLNGFFYCYDNPIPGRLVVFDHGMGNGHRAYMREIERLCRAGFLVFSYDHTGCMRSGGDGCNGFATSLSDLDACISALKAEPGIQDRTISVVGHSWGGFSTMNISAIHPEITHVVSMSGFVSVEQIVNQSFSGLLSPYRAGILALERSFNPEYVAFSAIHSLRKSKAQVLLIYSDDDKTVSKAHHFDLLQRSLADRENIRFLLLSGKDHNPTYTDAAVVYKNAFFKAYQKGLKRRTTPEQVKAFMDGFDWWKMTEQDEAVWEQIIAHLRGQ